MNKKIYEYCQEKYNEEYNNVMTSCSKKEQSEQIEKKAQLTAIKKTFDVGRKLYPNEIPELWKSIYKAHIFRKSGIDDIEKVTKVIQAEQSWRSSSGHAFEELVKELANLSLQNTKFEFLLQKDLNTLLKANEIGNGPTDIAWLKEKVKGGVFDLYVIAHVKRYDDDADETVNKSICFGCVQCKTSIRDRVSRDIVPSNEAMKAPFWSIGFVLDGTMFSVPKYKNMVNGNANTEFKKNGWHGMYVLSENTTLDRIYAMDLDFDIIKRHTEQAFEKWDKDRNGFTSDWRANE
ncbi:MAG: BsaWI family type II restriction enzyme [Paludibacteraceae bacterium]|nr:BsaWI family type II restriction enzyme [Paludibacteraceae bacterium]